jgi:protein-tyrosine-phosphatase
VRSRGALTRRGYDEGDILDPYGRGDAAYRAALGQIVPLAERIAPRLLRTPW